LHQVRTPTETKHIKGLERVTKLNNKKIIIEQKVHTPFLNITQYSLLTQTPSGKIRRGLLLGFLICSVILKKEHHRR
jgi:hypothetical protein